MILALLRRGSQKNPQDHHHHHREGGKGCTGPSAALIGALSLQHAWLRFTMMEEEVSRDQG